MPATNMHTTTHHTSPVLAEADRLMVVCNSCRYCEGLCAVFPAMEMRRVFTDGDLNYLANLCHGCGACYFDCQFSPPHEFEVNVPRALAKARIESYRTYAWPRLFSGLFARNGFAVGAIIVLSTIVFIAVFFAYNDPGVLRKIYAEHGAFYVFMPHNVMVLIFGAAFIYAVVAILISAIMFWRDIGEPVAALGAPQPLWQATKDAAHLKYLDGGEGGCASAEDEPKDRRKIFHHMTFYGFALCFAATIVATGYHYLFGREAPYAWYDLPVVLGTLGGVGLVIGPIGLFVAKRERDPVLLDPDSTGMDVAFIFILFATGATGLALLFFRETSFMGTLLALHLGVVFALFLLLPYSKFMHGIYRFLALTRYAKERATHQPISE
ncbi:MAG: tricarballylate utilization 4Fe-4S protein TcuB [Xanthobacteraceae bacterium]